MVKSSSHNGIARRTLIGAAGAVMVPAPAVHAQTQTGVALVIGNSKYRWEAQLPNPPRDTQDMARRFEEFGLKTTLVQDASRDAMLTAIERLGNAAQGTDLAAFYFAGHGAHLEKTTYLVPIDADLTVAKSDGLVSTQSPRTAIMKAKARMLVYDNCRNNPADGWRQAEAEDQAVNKSVAEGNQVRRFPQSITLWSTSPGRTALDGPAGQNSPFAAAMLRQFGRESVDLWSLGGNLRRDLLIATQGRQVLSNLTAFRSPFPLARRRPAQQPVTPAPTPTGGVTVVAIPKAYDHAKEAKVYLPRGLVVLKPPAGSPHANKIGAFKYDERLNAGILAKIMVVLAIDQTNTAQLIVAGAQDGGFWRFVTGKVSGNNLEYVAHGQGARTNFTWSGPDGGSLSMIWEKSVNARPYNSSFQRLDG